MSSKINELLKIISPSLRTAGFRGSGQNYRKNAEDTVCVINFQPSRGTDKFYINLGAQPIFIPAECDANIAKLKEYECVLRKRVGTDWPTKMSEPQITSLMNELLESQNKFFGQAQNLSKVIATESAHALLKNFSWGTTAARASLHLARAARALGYEHKARELASLGLTIASENASILRTELKTEFEV